MQVTNNFHIFVLISTLLSYFMLRRYKQNIIEAQQQYYRTSASHRKNSNFVYVLFVPVLLYIGYVMFCSKEVSKPYTTNNTQPPVPVLKNTSSSSSVITAPYPDSLSS